ncbi:hypothetical protein [Liquorilactobacillus mali]|nr:hypothetical protein [Liquorilactobacillus mali]
MPSSPTVMTTMTGKKMIGTMMTGKRAIGKIDSISCLTDTVLN